MAVKKDTKTGTWYFYGSYKMMNGKTKQYKKRGFAKKKDAVKAEILFRADIKTPYKNLTLEELFTLYSEYTEKRIKESTYNAQTSILQRWIDIIGKDMLIKKVTTSSLEYAMELMIRKTNSNSAANYLNRLDTFNKLGYKAKINTHTTSCINLFLDIYLYSEYRLIYC